MLRRLIGDSTDLAWLPKVGLWPVKMDPSQIDQALVNLCINARDAIAGVGKVTIETDMVAFDEEIVLSWIFACKFLMAWARTYRFRKPSHGIGPGFSIIPCAACGHLGPPQCAFA